MPSSCSAINCSNAHVKNDKRSYFKFPLRDKALAERWKVAIRRADWTPSNSTRICSDHFEQKCFRYNNERRSLVPNACPTIFTFPDHLMKRSTGNAPRKCYLPVTTPSISEFAPVKSLHRKPRKPKGIMEVCVDSIQSAVNAANGNASRLELCSALSEGGLTPTPGLLQVVKRLVNIPVFVMIRPHAGLDFVYTPAEVLAMKADARILKENGADGFVFGALTDEGRVDVKTCRELLDIISPLPATFHRAFDACANQFSTLETVVTLGFQRILTSGGEESAHRGMAVIRRLIAQANKRIIVMPGAGINNTNVQDVLERTGAVEFHGSAKQRLDSKSHLSVTSSEEVGLMVNIARQVLAT